MSVSVHDLGPVAVIEADSIEEGLQKAAELIAAKGGLTPEQEGMFRADTTVTLFLGNDLSKRLPSRAVVETEFFSAPKGVEAQTLTSEVAPFSTEDELSEAVHAVVLMHHQQHPVELSRVRMRALSDPKLTN